MGCGTVDCCDRIDCNLLGLRLRTPKIIKALPFDHEFRNVMIILLVNQLDIVLEVKGLIPFSEPL